MAIGICALPLVWALQRFQIGKTLSVFVILWGVMVMLTAVCKNYAQLVVVRVFLGESSHLAWYPRGSRVVLSCASRGFRMDRSRDAPPPPVTGLHHPSASSRD